MPVAFKDLSKKANDALDKGFDSANSVKVNTTSANGVKYSAEIKSKGSGKVAGKVGASFKHSSGFNVKKLEIANNGTLTSDITLTGAVDNTTFNLGVVMRPLALPGNGEKVEVGVDYAHEKAQATLKVSPLDPTGASLSILAKVHDNVLVGGSYAGVLDDTWVHSANNVGLGYTNGNANVSLNAASSLSKFTIGAHLQHSNDIAFAARVGLTRANPSAAAVTLGATYKIDADTNVRAKLDVPNGSTDGATASFGVNQKISNNVRLTAATTVQLNPDAELFDASFNAGLQFGSV